jgi:hypothetical protein
MNVSRKGRGFGSVLFYVMLSENRYILLVDGVPNKSLQPRISA